MQNSSIIIISIKSTLMLLKNHNSKPEVQSYKANSKYKSSSNKYDTDKSKNQKINTSSKLANIHQQQPIITQEQGEKSQLMQEDQKIIESDDQIRKNKLNLVLDKQPKQVQQKLFKLLINYNAVLQYNKNEDLFEVDLLLPFDNTEQRNKFIQEFLAKRSKQSNQASLESINQNSSLSNNGQYATEKSQLKSQSQQKHSNEKVRKYSTHSNKGDSTKQKNENHQNHAQMNILDELYQQKTPQMESIAESIVVEQPKKKQINFFQLSKIIDDRITKAIKKIRSQDTLEAHTQNHSENERQSHEADRQNHVEAHDQNESIQMSIVHQFNPTNSMSGTVNKNLSEASKSNISSNQILIQDDEEQKDQHIYQQHKSQFQRYHQVIEEDYQNQHDEPLFPERNHKANDFQSYKRKYDTAKKTEKQSMNKSVNARSDKKIDYSKNSRKNASKVFSNPKNQDQPRQNYEERDHSYTSQSQISLKKRYNEFIKSQNKNLQKIYDTIKKELKSGRKRMKQIQKDNPSTKRNNQILVQEFDDGESFSEEGVSKNESKLFKQQMIKQYREKILVLNESMSSEDLVRYFRYLMSNARKLYVKFLMQKKNVNLE